MIEYLLRRLGSLLLTVFLAVTLAFFALRILPVDVMGEMLSSSGATPEQIADRRTQLGLDQPLIMQYLRMIGGMLSGDFGESFFSNRPVTQIITEQIQPTAVLGFGALIIAVIVGVSSGIVLEFGGKLPRTLASILITLSLASPVYLIGLVAIFLFSVQWRLLPSAGGKTEIESLILPWSVLGLSLAGSIARVTAASLSAVRQAEFIRTAQAKGLRRQAILTRHMLRASASPIISVIALQVGFLLGGAIVTEMMFVRAGLGQVMINAVNTHDFPVVQGMVVLSAVIYSSTHTAADILSAVIDPRIRSEGGV